MEPMSESNESGVASSGAGRLRVSPFCKHLASKKLMISDSPPMVVGDVLDASQHCWCARTMQTLGPDRFECHPEDCTTGRDCFESPLAGLL